MLAFGRRKFFLFKEDSTAIQIGLTAIAALMFSSVLASEKGHGDHAVAHPSKVDLEKFKQINEQYLAKVKPLFHKKCFECHGSIVEFPWYYSIPGAKQLMQYDMRASKEHVDMTTDFPFKGHGTVKETLEEIKEVVENGSMPPFRYRIMNWDSALSTEEQKIVIEWVNQAISLL